MKKNPDPKRNVKRDQMVLFFIIGVISALFPFFGSIVAGILAAIVVVRSRMTYVGPVAVLLLMLLGNILLSGFLIFLPRLIAGKRIEFMDYAQIILLVAVYLLVMLYQKLILKIDSKVV